MKMIKDEIATRHTSFAVAMTQSRAVIAKEPSGDCGNLIIRKDEISRYARNDRELISQ